MNVCIFGAGAIGSFLAVHLAQDPRNSVEVVARGAQRDAINAAGLRLILDGRELVARVPAAANAHSLANPRPDVVFVTLKSHSIAAAADGLELLARSGCMLVFVGNGLPWWYGAVSQVRLPPASAAIMDSAGLAQRLDLAKVVGCVAYAPNTVLAPGVSKCASAASKFFLGPIVPEGGAACEAAAQLLRNAAVAVPASRDIKFEVWRKLLLNAALSPVAALTGGNNHQIVQNEALKAISLAILREVIGVAATDGVVLHVDETMLSEQSLPAHKPSMLQDLERNVSLETDSILDRVLAVADAAQVPTPTLQAVTALVKARSALNLQSV